MQEEGKSEGTSGGGGGGGGGHGVRDGTFPGGHWHLEGMAPERIVATGIYYYDMTNIQVHSHTALRWRIWYCFARYGA